MGTTAAVYAVALGEAAPTPPGPVAVLGVTVVLLLLLGAVFWSFLRRARREGVAPLTVDRRVAPTATAQAAATVPTAAADSTEDAETAAAIQDEIAEGGPVDGTEERS